jgi:hypothetical protein
MSNDELMTKARMKGASVRHWAFSHSFDIRHLDFVIF